MADQIGFSFQADVVNTASLGHVLTGRLLKALSDGGVDTYAMWAAVQLGKRIPVQSSHQNSLHAHIMSKKTYQSVLSKALSIGRGHSAPVADLARTVAGTNAIVFIGALATGCQAFAAAQCLSEVLIIHGLEADALPSVDVLKGLVNYLAPYTQDLGFSKVLHHITNLAERVIRYEGKDNRMGDDKRNARLLTQLKDLGGAAALAGAIKQLVYSARMGQRDYMALKMRGSWLPAFASHILGMSVEVRFNRTTIWASGGDHGHCLFQLGDEPAVHPALHPFSQADGVVARIKEDNHEGESDASSLIVDYLIGEALEAQFLKRPEIDADIAASIRVGIKCLSFNLLKKMVLHHPHNYAHCNGGLLNGERALEDALISMGIDANSSQQVAPGQEWYLGQPPVTVGRLIHCSATTALALMFCNFDAAEVRVQEKVLAGDVMTRWSQNLVMGHNAGEAHRGGQEHMETKLGVKHRDVLYHLGELICCDYALHWLDKANESPKVGVDNAVLGISGRAFTINYKCVMENECFDHCGRIIRIQSGRASVAGNFRNVVVEELPRGPNTTLNRVNETAEVVALAGRTMLKPGHRPSETEITMDAFTQEHVIFVQLKLRGKTSRPVAASFTLCVYQLISCWAVPKCNHEEDKPYMVENDQDVAVSGFHVASLRRRDAAEVLVYASHGNKLEQLLVCGLMLHEVSRWADRPCGFHKTTEPAVLQASACLRCCIRLARQPGYLPCVVMGG
ncbi:hypothetical protein CTAM01_07009 [Colletotrichum tamarilloi]|uniref:Uncharacterized protein n=1 Tax=Colletotrichum tamarilloi TaxID=1209934 RepID=A0ABQ9R9P5_9PEZI|nr:uncharacterized protein CTAM01_07009 [Colletotrichum tamarilloi]KAK1499088.1 hypothetical protein CTAM01_07009 [Colletotrichum tamarilloi]